MTGLKRNLHTQIEQLLHLFPVVMIVGVRQCGKTTLSKQIRPDWKYLDLERSSDYDKLSLDFDFFFQQNPENVIFDEAQLCPELFKELRGVIDNQRQKKNRYLLTGSSSPELLKNASESLAGRIAIVELAPLKTNEVYGNSLSPFYSFFNQNFQKTTLDQIAALQSNLSQKEMMISFLKGGYPEPVTSSKPEFYSLWMENYFKTYIQKDVRSLFPQLDLIKYQRFISMLSSLSGTIINKSQLGRSLDCSEVSIRDYLDIADGTFIWRKLLSFENSKSKSIVKMPKGHFRDSGLLHFLQNINSLEQLNNSPIVGTSFESFICEEIIKGLQAQGTTGLNFRYFRTRNGAEVDLILTGPFGIVPIEIKYGVKTNQRQLSSLKNFVERHDLPLGILVNNADQIELLAEKVIQVPARFL